MDVQQRFARLVEPYHAAALAFARCLSRSSADGDDLFQTAVVRALEKLGQLRDDAAFRGWFYRVIVTVHRNSARRAFWRRMVPFLDDHGGHARPAADSLDGAHRAQRALAGLPPEQRAAIVLFEIEGWSVEEIAALDGVSSSAVKSRLVRARERLRIIYSKQLGVQTVAALSTPEGTP